MMFSGVVPEWAINKFSFCAYRVCIRSNDLLDEACHQGHCSRAAMTKACELSGSHNGHGGQESEIRGWQGWFLRGL